MIERSKKKIKKLPTSQYGFLRGFSIADAMINLNEQLFSDLNSKNHILSVFVDLRNASTQ